MRKDEFYCFGRVLKTHGNKGHLIAHSDLEELNEIPSPENVFVEFDGTLVPFFPDHFEVLSRNTLLIKFDEVTSPQEAERFTGKNLHLLSKILPRKRGKQFYKEEVKGFLVVDENLGEIGSILEIIKYPSQTHLLVQQKDREILIPVVDEFILEVDRKKRIIRITVPEDLINLNN